jgi:hypothetical protein
MGEAEMPKCKRVDVDVHLQVHDNPQFYFETKWPTKSGKKDHLMFKNGAADGFMVHYNLKDPDNVYSFGNDLQEALYSTDQPVCPGPDEPGQWDQFQAYSFEQNGMTLVVWNKNDPKNGDPMDFGYALRVIKAGDEKYLHLDPIGTNSNSNSKNVALIAAGAFVVGAVLGAIAADVAMPMATTARIATAALIGGVVALGLYLFGSSRAASAA